MEATQYRLENQLDNEENRKEKKTNQLQDDIPYTVDLKNNFLVTIMGILQICHFFINLLTSLAAFG